MSKKSYTAKEAENINKVLQALGLMEITKGGVDYVQPVKKGDTKKTTKKLAGGSVGRANYRGKKKVQPTPEELKGMKKKKPKKKESMIAEMGRRMGLRKKGGKVGSKGKCSHNRLY